MPPAATCCGDTRGATNALHVPLPGRCWCLGRRRRRWRTTRSCPGRRRCSCGCRCSGGTQWATGTPNNDVNVLTAITITGATTTSVTGTPLKSAHVAPASVNLPAWNYATNSVSNQAAANFTFLYKNTVVQGTTKTAGGTAVPGMTITLRRCFTSTANGGGGNTLTNVSGPQPATGTTLCTAYFTGQTNVVTAADGSFMISGLTEGVYEITPAPGTVSPFTTSTPAQALYLTVGSGDIESYAFVIS